MSDFFWADARARDGNANKKKNLPSGNPRARARASSAIARVCDRTEMVRCAFIISSGSKNRRGRGGGGAQEPHQCRNPSLLGEQHCRDHASDEEIERRNSLSDADIRRLRAATRNPPSSSSSAKSSASSVSLAPRPTARKRTKLSAPPPPPPVGPRSSSARRGLPPELHDLVLAHFDIDDLAGARRDPTRFVLPALRRALDRKIRGCEAPGICRAVYRGRYAEFYGRELRRETAHSPPPPPPPSSKLGDEKKRVRSPEARKVDSGDGDGGNDDDEKDAAKSVGARLARKCAAVCLTDTAAIETLLRAYTGDANRVGDDIAP